MKQFLREAFKITPFHIAILAGFAALKYFLNETELEEKLKKPLLWAGLALGVIFVSAAGIQGFIESKIDASNSDETKEKYHKIAKRLTPFTSFGTGAFFVFWLIITMYIFTPTTWQMALFFIVGVVIGNIARHLKANRVTQVEKAD